MQSGRIVDVVIKDISFGYHARVDFNAFIRHNGIDGLIGELEHRSP